MRLLSSCLRIVTLKWHHFSFSWRDSLFYSMKKHVKRAVFQSSIWTTSHLSFPSPEEYGWTKNNDHGWVPVWMTIPEEARACSELIKCGCKSNRGCTTCKCIKAGLSCILIFVLPRVKSNIINGSYNWVLVKNITLTDANLNISLFSRLFSRFYNKKWYRCTPVR